MHAANVIRTVDGLEDRKKDTDMYTRLLDSEGEGEGGMIWENGNYNMYTVM